MPRSTAAGPVARGTEGGCRLCCNRLRGFGRDSPTRTLEPARSKRRTRSTTTFCSPRLPVFAGCAKSLREALVRVLKLGRIVSETLRRGRWGAPMAQQHLACGPFQIEAGTQVVRRDGEELS